MCTYNTSNDVCVCWCACVRFIRSAHLWDNFVFRHVNECKYAARFEMLRLTFCNGFSNAPDSVDRMTPFFFSCNWWLCRTTVAYIEPQCKCDEGNSIRLSTDFKDLITANKPFDVSDCYKMEFEFFSLLFSFSINNNNNNSKGNTYSSRLMYDFDKLSRI